MGIDGSPRNARCVVSRRRVALAARRMPRVDFRAHGGAMRAVARGANRAARARFSLSGLRFCEFCVYLTEESRMNRHRIASSASILAFALAVVAAPVPAAEPTSPNPSAPGSRAAAVAAFATVQKVLQHPRCQNCHIPGDAPLQFDAGLVHAQNVQRGATGHGAAGLNCSACHGDANLPASYGAHAPPGAPHWSLPPPERRMVTIGLPAHAVCEMLKDPARNGGRDFAALIKHVDEDALVLWGWSPGGERAPVSVPHDEFVAKFKVWAAAGGPCPAA
jgi:hypothetical protein